MPHFVTSIATPAIGTTQTYPQVSPRLTPANTIAYE